MPRQFTEKQIFGYHGAYVSNAVMWSATTRRLLLSGLPGEVHLALVAVWKCLSNAMQLVDGHTDVAIPGNADAQLDMPLSVSELRAHLERAERFRDEALHLQNLVTPGRGIEVSYTRTEPYLTYTSSVNLRPGQRGFTRDQITRPEIEALLDTLDPWLKNHHHRWIEAARASDDDDQTPEMTRRFV